MFEKKTDDEDKMWIEFATYAERFKHAEKFDDILACFVIVKLCEINERIKNIENLYLKP